MAIASFSARNTDELSLNEGDRIVILETPEGGWWRGALGGQEGWFPSNHVQTDTVMFVIELNLPCSS